MKEFTLGTTIRFTVEFRDPTSTLPFDPSSTWGAIFDSSSTMVASIAQLTRTSTGMYYHDWQTVPGSHALGVGAMQGYGQSGQYTYTHRATIFKLF